MNWIINNLPNSPATIFRITGQSTRNELAKLGDLTLGQELNSLGSVFADGRVYPVPDHQRQNRVIRMALVRDQRRGQGPALGQGEQAQRRGQVQLNQAGEV